MNKNLRKKTEIEEITEKSGSFYTFSYTFLY